MATAKETILQAVRAWIKSVTGFADDKVIPHGDSGGGSRPAMPYLTVQVLGPGAGVGRGEALHSVIPSTGQLQEMLRGHRRCTAQVTAYGTDAAEYLEQLKLSLCSTTAQAAIAAAVVGAEVGIANVLSERPGVRLRDTGYEDAGSVDFEVTYRIETTPEDIVAAEHIGWTITVDQPSNPPPDITISGTADL
jgi:hypothetical protein